MTCRPLARPASAADAQPSDVRGESRHDDAALGVAHEFGEALGDIGFRRAFALAQNIGGIADEREHALFAERPQPRFVGEAADERRRVDLPVAGMHDEPRRRADRERAALGDRMRDGDELDVERADVDPAVLRDDPDRDFRRARFAQPSRLGEARGEARHVDGHAEPRPELGERADMILVRVGDDEADEVVLDLLDEGEVGHDEIDARQILAREGEAEIDHQPFAAAGRPKAVERAIHADFAETAERREHELAVVNHLSRLSGATRRRRLVRARRGGDQGEVGGFDGFYQSPRAQEKATARVDALEHALARAARTGDADRAAEPRGRGEPFLADRGEAGAPRPMRQAPRRSGAPAAGTSLPGRPAVPRDGSNSSRDRQGPAARSRG